MNKHPEAFDGIEAHDDPNIPGLIAKLIMEVDRSYFLATKLGDSLDWVIRKDIWGLEAKETESNSKLGSMIASNIDKLYITNQKLEALINLLDLSGRSK